MLDRMGCSRHVKLAVNLVDDKWCIADDRITHTSCLGVNRAVIVVNPTEVMLIHAHHDESLDMALVVAGQRRLKINGRDLVSFQPRGDDLVSLLASDHGTEYPTA